MFNRTKIKIHARLNDNTTYQIDETNDCRASFEREAPTTTVDFAHCVIAITAIGQLMCQKCYSVFRTS